MLDGKRCAECGRLAVGTGACPFCGSEGGTVERLSGRARLLSWTVIRIAPARYAAEAPYAVGIVELEEGARLTARLGGDPERLAVGQSLAVTTVDPLRGPIFA